MKLLRIFLVNAVLLGGILFQAGAVFAHGDRSDIQQRETVLDRIVHIEKDLFLQVSDVPRWCDRLDLKKSRVNVGDCELYVEEEGSGIPIVLLHGGPGGTHHGFHPEFSRLKTFARLIYYDQRGCGLSDYERGSGYTISQAVDDLENLRKALQIERWIVLGWSYGGLLAQRYALKFPESVSGLILIASGTGTPPKKMGETRQHDYISSEEKQRITEVSAAVVMEAKKLGWSREKTMELLIYNRHINGDWKRQHYYKPTPEQFAMGALYEWRQDTDFNAVMSQDQRRLNLKGAFENCPIPTLIFEAKWDLTWMPEKIEEMRQNHPGVRLVVLEQAGHVLFRDEPEKFFRELKSFIGAMPPVSGDEIAHWKKYLADWGKNQVDPLLASPMSEAEDKSIAEFHDVRKKIKAGEKYEDLSAPFRAFLSFLSAVHHRDPEALKRIQNGAHPYSSRDLESWESELANLDILRAPLPPENPEPGTMWPVFLKDPAANTLVDTHLFGFWQGQWIRTGNMGGPADWRPFAEKMKEVFIDLIKKKSDTGRFSESRCPADIALLTINPNLWRKFDLVSVRFQ